MYETQAELDAFFQCLFQFRPLKKLGEGAFGMAILVLDEVEQVHKVFKLPKDQRTTEALLQEGANLRKLSELLHPNIIRLHQYGKVVMEWNGAQEERYYLNMAFGGKSLRGRLGAIRCAIDENGDPSYRGSGRGLPVDEALQIAIDICQGLEAAHGFRGAPVRMLHRDISPDNILIDDETGIGRITDFGIARVIDRSSALASFAGKLLYMDPECFKGRSSVQSDLYSLGVVIYEMITGDLPFRNFQQRIEGPPRPPHECVPEVPPELSAIVLRLLANDTSARYASASELLSDLKRIRARLNPLPARYVKQSELPDGRLLCDDRETGQRVAIRLVTSSASLSDLEQLCDRLETLGLAGVVLPRGFFRNEETVGVVAPPPEGTALAERFPARALQKMETLHSLCEIVAGVCDLLAKAHELGTAHGCLSPWALTITESGLSVHELGLGPILRARPAGDSPGPGLAQFGAAARFSSPQLLSSNRDPGPGDDVFSLGAILHELLLGRRRFSDSDRARVVQGETIPDDLRDLRVDNPLLSGKLAGIVHKALHWAPQERFATLLELADALRGCRWPEDVVESLVSDALESYSPGGDPSALIRACELLDLAQRLDPGNARVHFARGVVYFRNGSYPFAIEQLQKAARVDPAAETLDFLGQAHLLQRQYAEAVRAFRQALEVCENPMLLERLAMALHALGKRPQALERLRRAIELEPQASVREHRQAILDRWETAPGSAVADG